MKNVELSNLLLMMMMMMICNWVRALTVPMHLGLINGPHVPHNLILAQGSPVPLLKFQMAPRLKLLMSSGSKNGDRGGTVVKVLCYKSEGRWFDSRWCHLNFSLT
jgi:hypothetical protein